MKRSLRRMQKHAKISIRSLQLAENRSLISTLERIQRIRVTQRPNGPQTSIVTHRARRTRNRQQRLRRSLITVGRRRHNIRKLLSNPRSLINISRLNDTSLRDLISNHRFLINNLGFLIHHLRFLINHLRLLAQYLRLLVRHLRFLVQKLRLLRRHLRILAHTSRFALNNHRLATRDLSIIIKRPTQTLHHAEINSGQKQY